MHAAIPPISLSFWRWSIALMILIPFCYPHVKRQINVILSNKRYILIQAILGISCFNTLIYIAVNHTTAINAVLVNSCIPVVIVILSWLMFRDKISVRQGFGVLVSFSGVVYIISKGNLDTLLALSFNIGDLLVLVAAFVWAGYSVNLKKFPKELHPLSYLFSIVFVGVLIILPFYIWEFSSGRHFQVTLATAATISYVAVFASVLAFVFWNRAVREVGANKAGPFVHLMPVFSIILAVLLLDESLMVYHIKGMIAVFTGILLATLKFRKKS